MENKLTAPPTRLLCFFIFLSYSITLQAQLTSINVYAGGAILSGGGARSEALRYPIGVAVDSVGTVYISDSGGLVHKRTIDGMMITYAGGGAAGVGDGGPALNATLNGPSFLALDRANNLYLTESTGQRLRKISPEGIITTLAGTGIAGFSGDGGPAVLAQLNSPKGVVRDSAGNIFIADEGNNRIRKINTSGIITTIAGTGVAGYNGDNIPALSAELNAPYSLALDPNGTLFLGETADARVRRIDTTGMISTLAGTGVYGYTGDYDSVGTSAQIGYALGMVVDNGYFLFSDSYAGEVRGLPESGGTIANGVTSGSYFSTFSSPRGLAITDAPALNTSFNPSLTHSRLIVEKRDLIFSLFPSIEIFLPSPAVATALITVMGDRLLVLCCMGRYH